MEAKNEESAVPGDVLSCGECPADEEVPGIRKDGNRNECRKLDVATLRRDSFLDIGL